MAKKLRMEIYELNNIHISKSKQNLKILCNYSNLKDIGMNDLVLNI